MSGIPFRHTPMGRDFYDRSVPELVRQIARLNDMLERVLARLDQERAGR